MPTLLAVQAGEIHTGAFDDFQSLIPLAHQYKCWVHIDGAFGLWAAASKTHAHHLLGSEKADSWAVDGHKWLNVPYDSGYAFVAHPDAHFLSLSHHAAYIREDEKARDQFNWNAELSRRARGFSTYAAIKELGASGIEELVDRSCQHATAIVEGVSHLDLVEILAKPQINQGLLRFTHPNVGADEDMHKRFTEDVINEINASGEAFFQPSTFKGKRCMRISVSGWRTRDEDVKRTVIAIKNALEKIAHQVA
jgi:glutamate/tyrosine decarboxylase-like PLP-dependent enzyme